MGNIYVNKVKDTVADFHKQATSITKEIQDNRSQYAEPVFRAKNEELEKRLETLFNKSMTSIADTFNTVKGLLALADLSSVSWLTADRELFTSGIVKGTVETLAFVERYSHNFTMLKFISNHIKENDGIEWNAVKDKIKSLLPESQVEIYKEFAESGINMICSIMENPLATSTVAVNDFANPDSNYLKEKFEIIGDGLYLADYKTNKAPEFFANKFEDVKIGVAYRNTYCEL